MKQALLYVIFLKYEQTINLKTEILYYVDNSNEYEMPIQINRHRLS